MKGSRLTRTMNSWLTLFLAFVTASLSAQVDGYQYARNLSGVQEQWHQLTLPDDLFSHTQRTLHDLRVVKVTEAGDTLEIPFVLNEQQCTQSVEKHSYQTINATRAKGKQYMTFDLGEPLEVNRLHLVSGLRNFDWRCSLEGSQTLGDWEMITENQRILAIQNGHTEYSYSTLHIPTTRFRYLRVGISGQPEVQNPLTSAVIEHRVTSYGQTIVQPIQSVTDTVDRATKRSVITLRLPQTVPVSEVRLHFADSLNFVRRVNISYVRDSTQTEQGTRHYFNAFASGYVSSLEESRFESATVFTDALQIEIFNDDNRPLTLDSTTVSGNRFLMTLRAEGEGEYWLLYGNDQARAPRYDLVHLQQTIPEKAPALKIGPALKWADIQPKAGPMEPDSLWLWVVIIAIVVVIGFFSFRMLKTS